MFKTEAEHIIKRALEQTKAEFTDEQIKALSIITIKIAARVVEEAFSSSSSKPGAQGKPNFFT
jgi:hypothetical protein